MKRIAVIIVACLLTACGSAPSAMPTVAPAPATAIPATPTASPAYIAYINARKYVEDHLKAPATAKWSDFTDDRTGYRALDAGRFEAWGYVDSENSFGALLRNDWRVVLRDDGGVLRVLYAKIGDSEVGSYSTAVAGPTPTVGGVTAQAIGAVSLRKLPNVSASTAGTMPADQPFIVTMCTGDFLWLRVELNGQGGWVQAFQVRVKGDLADVPKATAKDLGQASMAIESSIIDVITAFKSAGLEAENARPMTKDDYGMAPMLAREGMRFLIPSLGPDSGGRVLAFANADGLNKMKDYYDMLGKASTMGFSWVFVRDNILVQINGDLKEPLARRYEAALNGMK